MKNFEIIRKREGSVYPVAIANLYSTNLKDARKEFAQWVWDNLNEGTFGDNYTWHNDDSIMDELMECRDVTWYEEAGWYDAGTHELVLAEKSLGAGFDTWNEDVYTYWISER